MRPAVVPNRCGHFLQCQTVPVFLTSAGSTRHVRSHRRSACLLGLAIGWRHAALCPGFHVEHEAGLEPGRAEHHESSLAASKPCASLVERGQRALRCSYASSRKAVLGSKCLCTSQVGIGTGHERAPEVCLSLLGCLGLTMCSVARLCLCYDS